MKPMAIRVDFPEQMDASTRYDVADASQVPKVVADLLTRCASSEEEHTQLLTAVLRHLTDLRFPNNSPRSHRSSI